MNNFTNNEQIKNNYLQLGLQTRAILELVRKQAYFDSKYYAGLSKEDWESTREILLSSEDLRVNPEAEIILNNPESYVVWLEFANSRGHYKLDILLPKIFIDKAVGERKIDSGCPNVSDIKDNLIAGYCDPSLLATLKDILASGYDTFKAKLQDKINGTTTECFVEDALTQMDVSFIERDPYNKKFYKGSPGNICDYIVTIGGTNIKIDVKLINDTKISTLIKSKAHDADYIVAWCWPEKKVIIEKESDIESTPEIEDFLQELNTTLTKIISSRGKCFIGISDNAIDFETGKCKVYFFG